ncbi:MAG: hypothetical protein JWM44_2663 [Bacilli bacterium]|nr:hypothetical protein [Bacilli bacterium]
MDKPIQTYKLLEGWQISYLVRLPLTLGHSVETEKNKRKGEMKSDCS